jgi:cyclopropane fatty-acyl-phospholipid synthase-like methyltransferase
MQAGIYQTVLHWVPEGARVLDLGAGDGAFLEQLVRERRVARE